MTATPVHLPVHMCVTAIMRHQLSSNIVHEMNGDAQNHEPEDQVSNDWRGTPCMHNDKHTCNRQQPWPPLATWSRSVASMPVEGPVGRQFAGPGAGTWPVGHTCTAGVPNQPLNGRANEAFLRNMYNASLRELV